MTRLLLLAALLASVAGAAAAQTTTDFVAVLSQPADAAGTSFGLALVRLTDNAAPGTDVIVVRGQFRFLTSLYAGSRLRNTTTNATLQALMPGVATNGRFGGWGADQNTFTVPDAVTAAIQSGVAVVEVQTDNAPAGEIRGRLRPLGVTLDGRVTESAYATVATKRTTNAGFGPAIDVASVRVSLADPQLAVIAVTGRLNTGSNDGIGLFLGAQGVGVPVGTALGGTAGAGHFLGATEHGAFKADMPVVLGLALNPGGGAQSAFLDVVRFNSPTERVADYLGAAAQDGGVAVGPPDQVASDGTTFAPLSDVLFAFRNDGAPTSGFEIVVPRGALGFPVPTAAGATAAAGTLTASAFVVSATGFFSDVTVPGAITGGNPGFDVTFGTLAGGPFSASGGGFTALAEAPRGGSALRLVGPNPARAEARLALTLDAGQAVRVDVVDALGRTVAVLHDGAAPAGETVLALDVSALPAGVYIVRAAGSGLRTSQRLTVVR